MLCDVKNIRDATETKKKRKRVTKRRTRQVWGHERVLGTQPKIPVPGLAGCCTGRKEKVNILLKTIWNEWNSESEFEDAALALFYLHTA